MQKLQALLKSELGFPKLRHVTGRCSIADIYSKKSRCGIYVLFFENGEIYAGQSVDVTRRYVQHCKTHSDITHIGFKRAAKSKLDESERKLIWALEHNGFTLRNITFTSVPKGISDLDLIVSPDDQAGWLEGLHTRGRQSETRMQDYVLRRKYKKKFEQFLTKRYSDQVVSVLNKYVSIGIPFPASTEGSFWCCTCLPSYSGSRDFWYSRINVNWQEVFAIATVDDEMYYTFYMALGVLQEVYGESLNGLLDKFASADIHDHFYEPGGYDQIGIEILGNSEILSFLDDPVVALAIRRFNLNLMRKGPCVFSRYHCMDLADRLLSDAA